MKIKLVLLTVIGIIFMACNEQKQKNGGDESSSKKQMTTMHLTKAEFLSKVANYEKTPEKFEYLGDKPAIVDFYASWCGPCKVIAPILEELAAEYGEEIYIYKVDVDEEEELAGAFGIQSIPSLLFIPMNEKPQMMTGGMPKAEFKEIINEVLLKK